MIPKNKKAPFLIAASFLTSFIFIRLAVLLAGSAESEFAQAAKAGALPGTDFYIGSNIILFGYHIHHFYFGILFICLAGWLAIVGSNTIKRDYIAIVYGLGLGLFLDEIGLLLTWGDYYSALTYTISLFVLGIFINILYLGPFWKELKTHIATGKHALLKEEIKKKYSPLHFIDAFANKLFGTKTISAVFTATAYILIAILILAYPRSVHYFIAGAFIITGITYIINVTIHKTPHENI